MIVLGCVTLCILLSLAWWWRRRSSPLRNARSSSVRNTRSSPPRSTRPCRGGRSPTINESYLARCARMIMSVLPLPQYLIQAGRDDTEDKSHKNTSIRAPAQVNNRGGTRSYMRTEKSKYFGFNFVLKSTIYM